MARKTYSAAYGSHLLSLVKAGRTPESLAKEFEPSAPTIRAWVGGGREGRRGGREGRGQGRPHQEARALAPAGGRGA